MSCSAGQKPDFSRRVGSVFDTGLLLMRRKTGAGPRRSFGRKSVSSNRCERDPWALSMAMRRSVAVPSMARSVSSSTENVSRCGRRGDRP